MKDLQRQIEAIEKQADESELLAKLAVDAEIRLYNESLAKKLLSQAAKMRRGNAAAPSGETQSA